MTVEDLLHLVPNLITKVDSLETKLKQTKLTMGKAIVKLVKKEEEISPIALEAAKTLSKVASQRLKLVDKDKRYKRRKVSKGEDISTGFEENWNEEELTEATKAKKKLSSIRRSTLTQRIGEAIRAKLEANPELTKNVLVEKFQKRLSKKMGTWKLTQLKKLSFEEVKEEFDKLVKQVESFVPMNIEATKAQLKRYGEELQTEISKKTRIDDKDVSVEEKITSKFLALGWHLEEIHVPWAHLEKKRARLRTCTKIHQEVLLTERGDGVAGIKQRRHNLSGDGVWILATESQRS
ncbi:hypothetical protein Tco_0668897 [Tanacetum coccineum]